MLDARSRQPGLSALHAGPDWPLARLAPAHLRCEYQASPQAVVSTEPRLSWVVDTDTDQRGVSQSAYRILVASSRELLQRDQADLWDSGKVQSNRTLHVLYGGKRLESAQVCHWKVRLWNQAGEESAWSEPAEWAMGLLKASDWHAHWIGLDSVSEQEGAAAQIQKLLDLQENKWVWTAGATGGSQPAGKAYFRKVLQVPSDRQLTQAKFILTADDGFQLFVNGHPAAQGTSWQSLTSVELTGRLQPGANAIGIEVTNGGTSPSPAGLIGRLVLAFDQGEPLVVSIDESWQSNNQPGERWAWVDFDASTWKPATAVAKFGDQPWGKVGSNSQQH